MPKISPHWFGPEGGVSSQWRRSELYFSEGGVSSTSVKEEWALLKMMAPYTYVTNFKLHNIIIDNCNGIMF